MAQGDWVVVELPTTGQIQYKDFWLVGINIAGHIEFVFHFAFPSLLPDYADLLCQ
jgi:hypothetical protein